MNILIDIGHPAHVHLLRNLYFELLSRDHKLILTIKNNLSEAKELLNYYKIPFLSIGTKSDNLFSKALKQISYDIIVARIAFQNKIDLGIGTSINLAHASKISKMKSIVLDDDDDEVQPLFTKFAHPFCDTLLSPSALIGHRKKSGTIFYAGYHELAYLHPNRFQPDRRVLEEANLQEGEKYFVLRFNSFKAHHDIGIHGLSIENKRKIIELLKPQGKIFITSERELESEFEEYRIKIEPHQIHSFLYYATMFIGDSQTMTSEAAILGTTALKCNSFAGKLSVPNELEKKHELCYSYLPEHFNDLLVKAETLLNIDKIKHIWKIRRDKMLMEKIDVSSFLIWFVENYPHSIEEFKTNLNIQEKFK